MKIRSAFVLGLVLLFGSVAFAQDYPKLETSPAFMYIRTPTSFTIPAGAPDGIAGTSFNESFNCAGAGGTIAYNVSSVVA